MSSRAGVQLAPRVYACAPGDEPRALPPGALVIPQRPSRAFGDGTHPTTRLCARAVDLLCRQGRVSAALDVGTGTGVLARIARAHDVGFVAATDIDPLALEAARVNVALDGGGVEVSDAPPDAWGPRFDLVVANILAGPLRSLAGSLVAALAPGGVLLLSGFTPPEAPGLRVRYARLGLGRATAAQLEGWSLLRLEEDR